MKDLLNNRSKIFITLFFLICSVAGFMVKLPAVFQHHDRQLHAAFYFLAAAFFTLLFAKKNFWIHALILILLAAFGIAIEHAQEFSNSLVRKRIHGRYDPEDVKYNLMGLLAFSGLWILYLLGSLLLRQEKSRPKSSALVSSNSTFCISTDKTELDIDFIHKFLSTEAYWSKGIPLPTVQKAIEGSLCFGVYNQEKQVGFARVITDNATIAYLGDVFIAPGFQGQGLGKLLMKEIMAHPELQGMRRWILITGDAHELYRRYGFTNLAAPERWMELHNSEVYK